jgi:DNA repair exonuclease SbcCD ATPase subunit
MRSEYFSSKEQGASFFPGGLPEYSQAELSGTEPSTSQRTSIPDNFKTSLAPRELKIIRRENETAKSVAGRVEQQYNDLMEEEEQMARDSEELIKLESMLQARQQLLRQLEQDIKHKQEELQELSAKVETDTSRMNEAEAEYTRMANVLQDKQVLVSRKCRELKCRQDMLLERKASGRTRSREWYGRRLESIVLISTAAATRQLEEMDRPSSYLACEANKVEAGLLAAIRLRRAIALQRQQNAEVFARVKLLAPK